MAAFSLSPTSYSITATVSQLDGNYDSSRKFVWYLDGVAKYTETVTEIMTERSYQHNPVYFNSSHTAGVEIYIMVDSGDEENTQVETLVYSDTLTTSTLLPNLTEWSWDISNLYATAAATELAYDTADERNLCKYFGYLVWDDLVQKVAEMRQLTGQSWLSTYATVENTLIGEELGSLTAQKINSLVANIDYPWWDWWKNSATDGYVGRLAFRSIKDSVYGEYMIELATRINNMVGIYNETTARTTSASNLTQHHISGDAVSKPSVRFGASNHSQHTINANGISKPSTRFTGSNHSQHTIDGQLVSMESAPMVARNHVRLITAATFLAYNPAPLEQYLTIQLAHDALLGRAPATTADITLPITAAFATTLSTPQSHGMTAMAGAMVSKSANLALQGIQPMGSDLAILMQTAVTLSQRKSTPMQTQGQTLLGFTATMASTGPLDGLPLAVTTHNHSTLAGATAIRGAFVVAVDGMSPVVRGAATVALTGVVPLAEENRHVATVGVMVARYRQVVSGVSAHHGSSQSSVVVVTPQNAQGYISIPTAGTDATVAVGVATILPQANATVPTPNGSGQIATVAPNVIPFASWATAPNQSATVVTAPPTITMATTSIPHGTAGGVSTVIPLPLSASNVISFVTVATATAEVPSSGWTYPVETEDGLEIYQNYFVYGGKDRIFVDFLLTAEVSANGGITINANAKPFVSAGWTFPVQANRILTVYQSLNVDQTDDEVEVD